jgi:4'-phosphopantetheinyl transferase
MTSHVDVRIVELTRHPSALAAAERLLDEAEIARADRFAFPYLRETFVLVHGVLRALLARYTPRVVFALGEHGKPRLTEPAIEFNLSHSGELAAYAFADCELGIDIEQKKPLRDLPQLARHSFCPAECDDLFTLSDDAFTDAFYACWTRKEAFIKATGAGLSYGLDRFRVSLLPNMEPAVLHAEAEEPAGEPWQLHAIDAGAGYAGALAYRGPPREVRISRIAVDDVLLL